MRGSSGSRPVRGDKTRLANQRGGDLPRGRNAGWNKRCGGEPAETEMAANDISSRGPAVITKDLVLLRCNEGSQYGNEAEHSKVDTMGKAGTRYRQEDCRLMNKWVGDPLVSE